MSKSKADNSCYYIMADVEVVIESPKGCTHKYDFEPARNIYKLKKILPAGLSFPFDFGFIPGTKGQDGDPLDVIVISEISSYPGCYMDVRVIGALNVEQTERGGSKMRNDRYLAVPGVTQLFSDIHSIDDLPDAILNQVEHFFINYNQQAGKELHILERVGPAEAIDSIAANRASIR